MLRCRGAAVYQRLGVASFAQCGYPRRGIASAPPHDTASVFKALQKKAHVRFALEDSKRTVMSREAFVALCTEAAADPMERMTAAEGAAYLDSLCKAGVVLTHNDCVYLRPKEIIDDVLRLSDVKQTFNTEHPEEQLARLALERADGEEAMKLDEHLQSTRKGVAANALWRRRFWAGVALASGTQMLGLSYLTFIVYGWDVMEPICYFVTAFTSLGSYLYFLWKQQDHTYESFDNAVLFTGSQDGDVHRVKLHADNVARIVNGVSVSKAVAEADDDLLEELLLDAQTRLAPGAR